MGGQFFRCRICGISQAPDATADRTFHAAGAVFDDECPPVVWTEASNADHAAYLRRVGFTQCPSRDSRYEIHLEEVAAA